MTDTPQPGDQGYSHGEESYCSTALAGHDEKGTSPLWSSSPNPQAQTNNEKNIREASRGDSLCITVQSSSKLSGSFRPRKSERPSWPRAAEGDMTTTRHVILGHVLEQPEGMRLNLRKPE